MRDRCAVFDRLHVQPGSLQGGNRTFAATSWTFDSDIHFLDTELHCFFGSILSGTLAGKRSTFTTPFETADTSTGPAERFALGVGDGDGGVVKGRLDMSDPVGHVTTDPLLLRFSHDSKYLN